jgi:hypothetical protein
MEQLRLEEEKQRQERKKESDRVGYLMHFKFIKPYLDLERDAKARGRIEKAEE